MDLLIKEVGETYANKILNVKVIYVIKENVFILLKVN